MKLGKGPIVAANMDTTGLFSIAKVMQKNKITCTLRSSTPLESSLKHGKVGLIGRIRNMRINRRKF